MTELGTLARWRKSGSHLQQMSKYKPKLICFQRNLLLYDDMYSELVYFRGAHFAHICVYEEHVRLRRIALAAAEAMSRRRIAREIDSRRVHL
jgi:hypothetical protein